jgi:hypothetical protein
MADRRHKDGDWRLATGAEGDKLTWEQANLAVLMDLRDELKALNRLLACPRFVGMPTFLRQTAEAVERLDRRMAKKNPLKAKRKT